MLMDTIQSRPSTTVAAHGTRALLYENANLPAARIPLPTADTANARNSQGRRSTKWASVTLSTNLAGCALGGSGPNVPGLYYYPNHDSPDYGRYFDNWNDIPDSCFENGIQISAPDEWP